MNKIRFEPELEIWRIFVKGFKDMIFTENKKKRS